MKRLLTIVLAISILSCSANSQSSTEEATGVNWYTFEEAVSMNQKEPRKIFVDVYTDWCSWCKTMDRNTFSHPQIAAYLNENYYPVKFNAESKEPVHFMDIVFENRGEGRRATHDLAAALLQGRLAYPSIAYLDENNQLLTSVSGYSTPSQLEPILVFFAEDHYKTKGWEEFSTSFEGGITE